MSTVILDTITGKSTATTITIGSTPVVSASANSMTIRGEGTAQTSIQQGLAKCWIQFNGSGTIATNDSFNVSGMTDRGTGIYTVTIANDMANDDYAVSGSGEVNFGTYRTYLCVDIDEGGQETAEVNINCGNTDSQIDAVTQFMTLHGDLA